MRFLTILLKKRAKIAKRTEKEQDGTQKVPKENNYVVAPMPLLFFQKKSGVLGCSLGVKIKKMGEKHENLQSDKKSFTF